MTICLLSAVFSASACEEESLVQIPKSKCLSKSLNDEDKKKAEQKGYKDPACCLRTFAEQKGSDWVESKWQCEVNKKNAYSTITVNNVRTILDCRQNSSEGLKLGVLLGILFLALVC